MAEDAKNCGTCHWRKWTVHSGERGGWECRKEGCAAFGAKVSESDGVGCSKWAQGLQVGTPFSQLTQSRFEDIGRTWGYD